MAPIKNKISFSRFTKLTQCSTQTTYFSSAQKCGYEEVKISVPWGHIAGKWWGPKDKRPILAIHGVKDNCGSFDRLAPYLIPRIGLLAIDFPGHGLSSHSPPGIYLHDIDYVTIIRRIVQYFSWSKVSLLGHSRGAATGYLYALFYPETIDFLICLDCIKPLIFEPKQSTTVVKSIDSFIRYDHLNSIASERQCYTLRELEEKLHKGTDYSVSLENCKYILQRNIAPSTIEANKFYFTGDARFNVFYMLNWPREFIFERARKLLCPIFMSYSSKRLIFYEQYLQGSDDLLKAIKETNRKFEFHNVDGTHHVHLNNPERIAELISSFIQRYDVEDRSVGGLKKDIVVKGET